MRSLLKMYDGRMLSEGFKQKPTVVLLASVVLVTIHCYFGSIRFAASSTVISGMINPVTYMFLSAFILFGLIPALIVKGLFKEKLRNFGLRIGDWKFGILSTLLLFPPILLFLLFPASQMAEMQSFYPLDRAINSFSAQFFQMELFRGVLYYAAWEFFFRGFMIFGLRKYVGDWIAICIQVIPQCLWHIGMPTGEIFSSILGGILFGYLALRTGSVIWPFLLHYLIGIGMDTLIIFCNS